MKRLLFRLSYLLRIPDLFRLRHRRSLTIVLYHGVAPRKDVGIYNYRGKFITPETFARQLAYMRSRYTVLPLQEALQRMKKGNLPEHALAITFDDGYRNFYEYALPALEKENFSAEMYLATDFVCRGVPLWVDRLEHAVGLDEGTRAEKIATDTTERDRLKTLTPQRREHDLRNIEQIAWTKFENFDEDRSVYAPLSAHEIKDASARGTRFGAHTVTHPILSKLTTDEQRAEIEGAKRDLETIGVAVSPIFAYPNGQPGDWNQETETILGEAGFTYALTTLEGVNDASTHPYRLHRMVLDATEDIATFANIITGVRLFLKSRI